MASHDSLKLIEFDHVEFAVNDLEKASELYLRLGFEKVGTRELKERQLTSCLLVQRRARVVLSHSSLTSDPVAKYVALHGEGVCSVGFLCESAVSALETAINRGAKLAEPPRTQKRDFGSVEQAGIFAFGDVRHSFISREGNLFLEGFEIPLREGPFGNGITRIDHITNNVEKGKMDEWAAYYENIFGFKNTKFFDIHTERTGLYSKVMQSPNGIIKMPINEPTENASQIQEFLDIHHGPGVQHIAFATENIIQSLRKIRKEGIAFLEVPSTYYEEISKRVPNITEDMRELSELGILADGDSKGYLLQIFTQNVVGPFFYEFIQRKGNDGFGEGNFKALFEAIERDQMRRGTLKDPQNPPIGS